MRIEWRTKWGLGGGHKCRATGALDEAGKSSLVSGGAEMWRNSISYHPALYIANCLFWKARKKNFQLFRALKPQPTSWVGWGTWLGDVHLRDVPVCRHLASDAHRDNSQSPGSLLHLCLHPSEHLLPVALVCSILVMSGSMSMAAQPYWARARPCNLLVVVRDPCAIAVKLILII